MLSLSWELNAAPGALFLLHAAPRPPTSTSLKPSPFRDTGFGTPRAEAVQRAASQPGCAVPESPRGLTSPWEKAAWPPALLVPLCLFPPWRFPLDVSWGRHTSRRRRIR